MAKDKQGRDAQKEVILSLISHTNVGKTALARTLLRRDVGEVGDRAHVTRASEAYTLIESEGRVAKLWDTPGFGSNLAKLAKRLRASDNPVGWILHKVWDRIKDESLWCSQEAIRNIREDADVVIYLVDASQSPDSVGYVDLEMEILGWMEKPVLVFLNQTGRPERERIANDENEWREHLAQFDIVKDVSTLDAFTRCWTEEHIVLQKAAVHIVDKGKRKIAQQLANVWMENNMAIFDESVEKVADLMVFALTDSEELQETTVGDKIKAIVDKKAQEKELKQVKDKMLERLQERTVDLINQLVALQGLDGESARQLRAVDIEDIAIDRNMQESIMAALGGAATGAVWGVAADAVSGGLTLGGGMIVGSVLGAGGGYALAKGYNLAKVDVNHVRWQESHFKGQFAFVAEIYLAVSHFGRGRGEWQDSDKNPDLWAEKIKGHMEQCDEELSELWSAAVKTDHPKLKKKLIKQIYKVLSATLVDLYPEVAPNFRSRI